MTKEQLIQGFDERVHKTSKHYYSDFYIGITRNIDSRLFGDHQVDREKDWWAYGSADDIDTARDVEKYFINKGMRGADGGGDDSSTYVYCYIITDSTRE